MLKQRYLASIKESLDDQEFYRFEDKFSDLDLDRVHKFSLMIAIANGLLAAIPNLIIYQAFPQYQSLAYKTFLLLHVSLTAFMLFFYRITPLIRNGNALKRKILLMKFFVVVILLHAFGLSIVTFSPIAGISIFLLSSCGLIVGLHWPAKRVLAYLGSSQLLFLLALFLIFRENAVWHTYLISHLLFGSIFFVLSRSTLELKLRDFQSIEEKEIRNIEQKKNKDLLENLSLVASHTDNAVMISDPKHRVEWVNEAFEHFTGFQLPEIINRYPKDFMVSGKTEAETLHRLNNCLREGKSFTDELLICDKNKEHHWMQLTVNPVFDPEGSLIKFVSVYTDLRKIKAYEQQLQLAKENAERSAESKENFLSSVSHELRTPLNAVIGLTQHMLQNEPREDQLEDLNILSFSAENLLSLINDILDLSKIEAGKVKIDSIAFNLRNIIDSLRQTFQNQAEAKGLIFKTHLDDSLPQMLMGDPVRLVQIMTNLLGNALKFTEQGSVSILVKSTLQDNHSCLLQISIEDTGIGITEDKLDLIFDKFEQASQASNRSYGGTGLGLSITKQLVELQGGNITVNSKVGKGSCFSFSISYPLAQAKDLESLIRVNRPYHEIDLKQLEILLVEDNKINQVVAGKFLKSWNIPYDIAENGMEAVKMAAKHHYSLILMDLQMPVMDGYEATRRIRALQDLDYSNIPIIAITASCTAGIKYKILDAGMNDIIFKPFNPNDLLVKLQQHCSLQKEALNPSPMINSSSPNIQQQDQALDLSEIIKLAGDDVSFFQELLSLYIEQFSQLHHETLDGLKHNNAQELRRIFHKMKPAIAMLRQFKIQALMNQAHEMLHDQKPDFKQISPLTMVYLEEIQKLKNLLQKELENNKFVVD